MWCARRRSVPPRSAPLCRFGAEAPALRRPAPPQAPREAHILEGLKIALDNIEEVMLLIRARRTVEIAHGGLRERYELSVARRRHDEHRRTFIISERGCGKSEA